MRGNTRQQFYILFTEKLGASGVAVGEVCSFDGVNKRIKRAAVFWTAVPFPDRTLRPPVYVDSFLTCL